MLPQHACSFTTLLCFLIGHPSTGRPSSSLTALVRRTLPALPPQCSYYHKVSGDMQLGVAVAKPIQKGDMGIEFGCAYKLDKDTSVKAKVCARASERGRDRAHASERVHASHVGCWLLRMA